MYTPAVDLWSAGVILYILLSGVVPFEDADEKKLFSKIARAAYSLSGPEFATVSSEAKRLIAGLMCLEPTRRFTARQALAHGWFERAARTSGRILSPPSASASAGSSTAGSAFATPQPSPRDAGLPPLPPSRKLSVEEAAAEAAEEEYAAQPLLSTVHGLAAYAARTKPPVRVFPAGAYLIRRGERATEVFLIRSGTCAIVLEEDEPPGAAAPGAAAAKTAAQRPQLGPDASPQPSPREKLMATRGPGDFVGEVGVVMDAKGSLMLPVGGAAAEAARADMLRGHGGRGVAANAAGGVGGGAAGGAAGGGGGGAEGGAAAAEADASSPRAPPSPSADKWCVRPSRHSIPRVAVRVSLSRRTP